MWSCSKQSTFSVEQKRLWMGGADLRSRNAGNLNIQEGMLYVILVVSWFSFNCRFLCCTDGYPLLGLPFTNSHNARSANLRFYIPHAGILQCVYEFVDHEAR